MISFLKKIFGMGEEDSQPTKISDHVAKKEAQKQATKVPSKAELKKLTKAGLEELGRENGVELDKRLTKDKLVNQLHNHMKGK